MASQLFVDLYACDDGITNDCEAIKKIAREAIKEINSEIVEECIHRFEPIGITYIAVITASHFSIHTWPENGYVAIDIFSCEEEVPDALAEKLKGAFGAKRHLIGRYERKIEGRSKVWSIQ